MGTCLVKPLKLGFFQKTILLLHFFKRRIFCHSLPQQMATSRENDHTCNLVVSFHVFNMCRISSTYSVFRDCLHRVFFGRTILWHSSKLLISLLVLTGRGDGVRENFAPDDQVWPAGGAPLHVPAALCQAAQRWDRISMTSAPQSVRNDGPVGKLWPVSRYRGEE